MIGIQDSGPVWTLTIRRPEKANSLTQAMLEDLVLAVERASAQGARALVLTAEGKVFSAGADLDAARAGLATSGVWERLSRAIADFPGLSIAALNGTVAGGAMGMVLACDLRLAVPGAQFFYPVMKLGYLPQPSDPARLAALVGPSRARMILVAGARIGADEALAWGLVDRIADKDRLLDDALSLTTDPVNASPAHLAAIKAMIPAG